MAEPKTRLSAATRFTRFWCANMDLVHSQGATWPGFAYTDDEKTEMHRIAKAVGSFEFYMTVVLSVPIAILVAGASAGLMFWHLNARYGGDPSKTPASEFFLCLALAAVTTMSVGLPISVIFATWLAEKIMPPDAASIPDPAFTATLFPKAIKQIVRMAFILIALCLVYWIFVPTGSKVDLLLHAVMPTLGPAVAVLTTIWLAAGRKKD